MNNEKPRALTKEEYELTHWLLENGGAEAQSYLPQLEVADATDWKCPCGCASFNLRVRTKPEPPPGVHVLGEFVFGNERNLSGVFVYSSGEVLSGVEVYGLAGDAPRFLPSPHEIRPCVAGDKNA